MKEGLVAEIFNKGLQKGLKLPGELPDFLAFLGVENTKQLENLPWTELETLPVVAGRLKIQNMPKGGNHYWSRNLQYSGTFIWWEVTEDGMNLEKGTRILGLGQISYDEAALNGLLSLWELVSLRSKWNPKWTELKPEHYNSKNEIE